MPLVLLLLLAAPAANPGFTNVAEEAGLSGVSAARAVFVDLNSDGRLDVVLDKQHYFLQGEDGRFQPIPGPELPAVPSVVLFADYDNDGDTDGFAAYACEPENEKWKAEKDKGQVNVLILNDGKCGWTVEPLGMPQTAVHAACTLDYDRDGKLDLFLGQGYVAYGRGLESHPDRLYRGHGDGTFVDVTKDLGLLTIDEPGKLSSSKPTYGVTHGDFDGDGWQDLWVCTYGRQWNHLWRNEAGKHFVNIAPTTGFDGDEIRHGHYPPWLKQYWKQKYGQERPDEPPFRSNGNTFDCAIADFDNDGDMDCILAEITHEWAGESSDRTSLLVQKDGRFERHPEVFVREHPKEGHWDQGDLHCGWIDYDNDGLLDALIASSDYPDRQELKLYRQKPDHTFEPPRLFGWEGAGQLSVGDYDRDGDLDILVGRSLMRLSKEKRAELGKSCALFRNDVGNKNRWLQVTCVGKTANRNGIGCRIEVTTPDGVTQTREIRGGLGHAGHNGPYEAHFGLGAHETADVTIRWPDAAGSVTTMKGVKTGQRLVVTQ